MIRPDLWTSDPALDTLCRESYTKGASQIDLRSRPSGPRCGGERVVVRGCGHFSDRVLDALQIVVAPDG